MVISNFSKYALTEEEVIQAKGMIGNIVSIERFKNMTNAFDLISFFKTELTIAVILITPNQVVIGYGARLIEHESLYYHMKKAVSKQGRVNPMVEVRCVSNETNGICYPVLRSKTAITPEMKEALIKIHSQVERVDKDVMLFDMEEFESHLRDSHLGETVSIHPENVLGISLPDYMRKSEIGNNFVYKLEMKPNKVD